MRKFSKLGATALALALSLTMVAPISANAAYKVALPDSFEDKYEGITQADQIKENRDSSGKVVSYTDLVSGETVTEEADLKDYSVPKKVQIPVKEWCEIWVYLKDGECEVKKVKSSSKDTIKASLCKFHVQEKTTEKVWTGKDAGGTYYWDAITDKKVYISSADAAPNGSYGRYRIRLYANKAGTSTVSYKVYDYTGAKKKTVKIKVTAKEIAPFASVTFGGKSVLIDQTKGATNSNFYSESKNVLGDMVYTTKKSGKFRIKMNKGYKLMKVITGTQNGYEIKKNDEIGANGEKSYPIKSEFKTDYPGTFSSSYTWKDRGTKKSFKLKLSTNPSTYEYEKFTYTYKGNPTWESRQGSHFSQTPVKIYFQDKNTKKMYVYETTIIRLLDKK